VTFVWRFALVFVVQGLGQLAPELLQLAAGPPAHPAHRLRHPAVVPPSLFPFRVMKFIFCLYLPLFAFICLGSN
jgi:hypothetical protein